MTAKKDTTVGDFLKSCLVQIVAFVCLTLLFGYACTKLDQPKNEEWYYAWYEVKYLHLSGKTINKQLYLPADGVRLEIGFCNGKYFIYDDQDNLHTCNSCALVYGATDILSYQKLEK